MRRLKAASTHFGAPWSLVCGGAIALALLLAPRAASSEAISPLRESTIVVSYTVTEWWLVGWADNQVACQIYLEHDGLPNGKDVYWACGQDLYDEWAETGACAALAGDGDTRTCEGLYLHKAAETPAEREVIVELPTPSVWLSLSGCTPSFPENHCDRLPALLLTGEEPLQNERVLDIAGAFDGLLFNCDAYTCEVPLRPTRRDGADVVFWADSSFGDSSPHFTARVRVVEARAVTPGEKGWYVDVLSSQWRGAPPLSCSEAWDAFPPVGGPPAWLTTPDSSEHLASSEPYTYLAGILIYRGAVPEASECPGFGLLPNGAASACGLEKARPLVDAWQNSFDADILDTARERDVPAQLMKNLFARESQFWPGIFEDPTETGLGQLTEEGADTTLLWNEGFYEGFCSLVLDAGRCGEGYAQLTQAERALLRGALFTATDAQCPGCPMGIDLTQANFSIAVFAETLQANCEQVGRILRDLTQQAPGAVSSYDDLWRFTLANYNAGSGCFSRAASEAWLTRRSLDWEHISQALSPACQGAVGYVERIAHP